MIMYFVIITLISTPIVWCALTKEKIMDELFPKNIKPEFIRKCYGDLGCFYTGPPFYHPKYRPVTVLPSPDIITKLYLFTPDNPSEKYELNSTEDSIKNSNFNGKNPVKVLIHGFQRQDLTDFYDMKDALLKEGNYNVIVVDWTQNNGFPLWKAIASARLNAAKVAKLLELLMRNTELTSSNIHLIAHSLGAEVAGWVGERIKKLGRISGLDPAGPYFHKAPPSVRLDFSDAVFIDVLHTNGGRNIFEGLGDIDPIGQINFYPNGGNSQPGCDSSDDLLKISLTEYVANKCDHNRAVNLYTATINSTECRFLAVRCASWDKFLQSECQPMNSMIAEMGFHAKSIRRAPRGSKFYLKTTGEPPFCKQQGYIA